ALRQRALGGKAPDHEAVVVLDLGGHPLPAELLGALEAGSRHRLPSLVVAEQLGQRAGDELRLAGRHEQRLAVAPDDALVAMDVAADDRCAGCHRLEQDDAEGFAPGGRGAIDVRGLEERIALLVPDPAEELDATELAGHEVAPDLLLLGPAADDEKPALAARLAQDAIGLEEVEKALARLEPADEEDVLGPVLPARDRHGALEAGDVDAVRDDLVVAREEA